MPFFSPTPNPGGLMRYLTIIFCVVLVLFSLQQAQARIIHVPSEQSTIQAGINASVSGDTVLVAPGTYYEHINFYGKSILVKSQAGADSTIISKLYDGLSLVLFTSGEGVNSILDGFTIQNANNPNQSGGGIYCYQNSSPTIRNNIIKQNSAYHGGGIACYYSSPIIQNNLIAQNAASDRGGGINLDTYCRPSIINNTFIRNSANNGGAIFCYYSSYPVPTISGNTLIENTATAGAGIYCWYYSSPDIFDNTLDRNISTYWGSIVCSNNCAPRIKNTIVSNDISYGVYATDNSFPVITYSDLWNNGLGNFFGCMPGVGCISADPIFCDTASDNYYLSSLSPCVGTGEGGADIGAFGIGCGINPRRVDLTAGPNRGGRAQTNVSVEFYVRNMGFFSDTYDLDITDSLGWTIVPTHYAVPLDSGESDTATFTVSIPYIPIGTVDKLRLVAISQIDSSVTDTAYLFVTCNAIVEGVEVTAGSNQSGYADSLVSVAFLVQNVGVVPDSYSLDISDTRGWSIVPTHYNLILDTAETEPVSFTVFIPYVPLGTVDQLTLLAVSKTNPLARDSASLNVICNAYAENWSVSAGANLSAPAHSQVTAQFYVQNTGLARDSCYMQISDSLGWFIDPLNYRLSLNPGQRDSVFSNVQIPSVPVGTTNKIILAGHSLTNPYVADTTFLLVLCSSYNITITNISDVGNDQGKQVHIDWSSFPGSDPLVTDFSVFRKKDSLLTVPPVLPPTDPNLILTYPPGQWEWLVTIPAFGETLYSAVVPTLQDSTIAHGMYWSVFFVRAGTQSPIVYFDSPVDSGYSLDNLFPSPPTGLFALHQPAITKLTWKTTTAPDFDYYAVYRDTLSGFTPGLNNKLGFTIDTTFVDSTAQLGRTFYYLVSATDFSGNESDPSNQAMGVRYITGDANTDGQINSADVVYLINYLFIGGSPPTPLVAGDANCDGKINVVDVVYLINYLFIGGPPPSC